MPIHVPFHGPAGDYLFRHIGTRLHQLADAAHAHVNSDERGFRLRLVDFLVGAAFGYPSRLQRYQYLDDINEDIYHLTFSDDEIVAEVNCQSAHLSFSLGHVEGFSAVLPLTARGYDMYLTNTKSAGQLTRGDIVASPYELHSVSHILISGLVHFPSLPRLLQGDTTFRIPAWRVFGEHLRHIGRFLPRLRFLRRKRDVKLETENAVPLPRIVCTVAAGTMGTSLLRKCGFVQSALDKNGHSKYVLDLADFNASAISPQRKKQIETVLREFIWQTD